VQRLYKSRKDKVLDGVCGGIGDYFNVDTVVIRVIWVLATIFSAGGFGILAYLIAMLIIPRESDQRESTSVRHTNNTDDDATDEQQTYSGKRKNKLSLLLGLLLIIFGGVLLLERFIGINLRALFSEIQTYLWPLLLIGLGVFLLSRRRS
jgi:phage shock protein C